MDSSFDRLEDQEPLEDDEEPLEEESEEETSEEEPLRCPGCGSESVRLVESGYESGLYECEACGLTFEEE